MSGQKEKPDGILLQANSCCQGFLENQIAFMTAVKQTLEQFDKETVIKQVDQILGYYQKKLSELPNKK